MADENSVGNRMPSHHGHESSSGKKKAPIPSFHMPDFSEKSSSSDSVDSSSFPMDADVARNAVAAALTQMDDSPMKESPDDNDFTATNDMEDNDEDNESYSSEDELLSSDGSVSTDATSSSSDDDEEEEGGLSLHERMLQNQRRNALFLESLHEKYQGMVPRELKSKPVRRKRRKISPDAMDNDDQAQPLYGMLRAKTAPDDSPSVVVPLSQRLQSLMKEYPYREGQIRRLTALLHGSVGACRTIQSNEMTPSSVHIPGPIFLSGPRGTGKTSIVKDVLQMLQADNLQQTSGAMPSLHTSYVNCATTEPASIDRLVADAYRQLKPTSLSRRDRRQRHRRHHATSKLAHSPKRHGTTSPKSLGDAAAVADSTGISKTDDVGTDKHHDVETMEEKQQPRFQPRRAAKITAPTSSISATTAGNKKAPGNKATSSNTATLGSDEHVNNSPETSHSAVAAFGRSLQRFFGVGSQRAAVLVVDHAERLLTWSARKTANEKTNFLAELLLLPKFMRLNLTIVVVSRYSLLYGTRLDNIAAPEKSAATLAGSVGGLTIQFPAYKDQKVIQEILKTDKLLPLVVGNTHFKAAKEGNGAFISKVIDGFFSSLVQYLSDSTIDLNEFLRIGRSLWPVYIKPLHPQVIKATLASMGAQDRVTEDEKLNQDLLRLLGGRFLSEVGNASSGSTLVNMDSTHFDVEGKAMMPQKKSSRISGLQLPFLRICLLLAAFVCQNNRAENDKKVFSVHGNGKRTRTRKGKENLDSEEAVAFASTAGGIDQLKSLRPRPFLVERVFSIFVTLVRLNPDSAPQFPGKKRYEYSVESLGTSRLYEDLRSLIDLGYIHPVAFSGSVRGEQINLNGAKCWCSLTAKEALQLAESVGIPLESYLV